MPFSAAAGNTRVTSGVTPVLVMRAMSLALKRKGVLHQSKIGIVLDDEGVPPEYPRDSQYITIRHPSLIWEQGEVATGDESGTLLSKLMVSGQTRHTLWLSSQRDLYGYADELLKDAFAKGPDGMQLLGQMVSTFWEQELVNEAGNALTNKPMRLVSLEMPPDNMGPTRPRPFRLTWEVSFTWDLSVE